MASCCILSFLRAVTRNKQSCYSNCKNVCRAPTSPKCMTLELTEENEQIFSDYLAAGRRTDLSLVCNCLLPVAAACFPPYIAKKVRSNFK